MLIRTYADIEKLEGEDAISPAEKKLIENCKRGAPTVLGDGQLPEESSQERTIRADLLRYLILGGCERCQTHEMGVQLGGAWIAGRLDLSFAHAEGGVRLANCTFEAALTAHQANFSRLILNGCKLPALNAQGSIFSGNVFIDDLISFGEVSFSAANITGQFSADRAEFYCDEIAFNVQGAVIRGGVFINGIRSTGEVTFGGAEIGIQISLNGAVINSGKGKGVALNAERVAVKGGVFLNGVKSNGEISFSGADIDGQLTFEGAELNGGEGFAANMQRLVVRSGLYWREMKAVVGKVDLNTAHLGDLVDDVQSWALVTSLTLVGATYEDLAGPLDLSFRKRWLKDGANFNGQFHPQPYQQLAKFYRETGHRYEAREILVAKEIEQRKATREAILEGKARTESWLHPKVLAALNFLWDWTTRLIAGYGYKPWLSLWWLGGLVAIMMAIAQLTWNAGDFAPNSAVVLTSQDWKAIADGPSENPATDWTDALAPGKDYETFYSFAYALDVVVPVLDLGQTDAWAPSPARGDWGYWMFYLQKIFIVLGWVVTAIAAAAISGMIRRDD